MAKAEHRTWIQWNELSKGSQCHSNTSVYIYYINTSRKFKRDLLLRLRDGK